MHNEEENPRITLMNAYLDDSSYAEEERRAARGLPLASPYKGYEAYLGNNVGFGDSLYAEEEESPRITLMNAHYAQEPRVTFFPFFPFSLAFLHLFRSLV
jgi:hypothetical protein